MQINAWLKIDFGLNIQKAPVEISENLWPFKGAFAPCHIRGAEFFWKS